MKRIKILMLALLTGCLVQAQENPVNWRYSIRKVSGNIFEVHITANIESGWHLYAQKQPEDAIALPTSFKFARNPFITLQGKVKEVGKKQLFKDETVGIAAYQYEDKVDFIQRVQLNKIKGKTNLNGTISFQACTNEKCLPPATTDFSVNLED
jgi:thiol:disulfide interchange protein DsbD